MDREKDFKLTGPELQTELLKRMEYREETRKCGNCKYYYRSMDWGQYIQMPPDSFYRPECK